MAPEKDPATADRIGEHMRALQHVVHNIRDATTGTGGSGRATGSGSDDPTAPGGGP
jgi:hypothetical protein